MTARIIQRTGSTGARVALAALLATVPVAQSATANAQDPVPAAQVFAVLDAERLDASAFLGLVRSGTRAVPGLLAALGSDWAEPVPKRPRRALRALRLIGPTAADAAMPVLLDRLARDVSRDDVELLDTIAVLAEGVADRQQLLESTRSLEIKAPDPTADMRAFLRWAAKLRLWYRVRQCLRDEPPVDLEAAVKKLDSEDPLQRERAARTLGALGTAALPALDDLVRVETTAKHPRIANSDIGNLTADFHDLVRDAAAMAIARIAPQRPDAQRGLLLLLRRADHPSERMQAAISLAELLAGSGDAATADDATVVVLLEATHDDDPRVAGESATALGRVAPRRDDVVARLRECASDADRGLAARASGALRLLERR